MNADSHTTNYTDTFIEVAPDYAEQTSKIPLSNGKSKSVALLQYELLITRPYEFTSDDVLFNVYAERNHIPSDQYEAARAAFFSKGQPCFRASPLTKKHGFGVHADSDGKIALYPLESAEYQKFIERQDVKKLKAMRSSKQ